MDKQIKDIIDSVEHIEEVKVSPFFKEKVMYQIRNASVEKEDKIWSWFTPQLQLATLVCIVALNVFAVVQSQNDKSNNEFSDFAETYGLNYESSDFLIN